MSARQPKRSRYRLPESPSAPHQRRSMDDESRRDTEAFLEHVAAALPLHMLAQEYVPLRRMGKDYRGPCPLHRGTHPNFSITPGRPFYNCFVCGESGNYVTFVRDVVGITQYPDILEYLSSRTGIAVPRRHTMTHAQWIDSESTRRKRLEALEFALRFYLWARGMLPDAVAEAAQALGWSAASLASLQVGYVPAGQKLAKNVLEQCPPDSWEAFQSLGLVRFEGEPGSAHARNSMQDGAPAGTILWPTGRGRECFGLVAFDASGRRVWNSRAPMSGRDPKRGGLLLHADPLTVSPGVEVERVATEPQVPAGGEEPAERDGGVGGSPPAEESGWVGAAADTAGQHGQGGVPGPQTERLLVWASPGDFLRAAAPLVEDATSRHAVPTARLELDTAADLQILNDLLVTTRVVRHDRMVVAGVIGTDGQLTHWLHREWVSRAGAVAEIADRTIQIAHVLDVAARDPLYDAGPLIEAVSGSVLQLALRGWWRARRAAREAEPHAAYGAPAA